LALVGEQGPELINFNQGGQVYTASQTRSLRSGTADNESPSLIRALIQEVANLRLEARASAVNTGKMARLQDKWDADGMPTDETTLTY